jgi:hypothetical protein
MISVIAWFIEVSKPLHSNLTGVPFVLELVTSIENEPSGMENTVLR